MQTLKSIRLIKCRALSRPEQGLETWFDLLIKI